MNRRYALAIAAVVIIALVLLAIIFYTQPSKVGCGYTEAEGFLEMRAHPKIAPGVPTVMVYVLVPKYDHYAFYITEKGIPLPSLEGVTYGDLVKIEGVLYSRAAVDKSETYWMLEKFNISRAD